MFDFEFTTALNHTAIQLFEAGLKPAIQDEMMKGRPVLLWDTSQQYFTLEKHHMPLKTNTPKVDEITEKQNPVALDGEIEAV